MTEPRISVAPHLGEVAIETRDGPAVLKFDWGGLSRLHGLFGDDWAAQVIGAAQAQDVKRMAQIFHCVSGRPVEEWMRLSPPIIDAGQAIERGLEIAFYGPGGAGQANPPTRLIGQLMRSLRLIGRGRGRAGRRRNSGA